MIICENKKVYMLRLKEHLEIEQTFADNNNAALMP